MPTKTKKPPPVTAYKYVVRLPADLGELLKERAAEEDRPISRVIRSAITLYLNSATLLPPR